MTEVASFFREFGYPAIISGLLIWFIVTKLEALRLTNETLAATNAALTKKLEDKLDDMEDTVKERQETDKRIELYLDRIDWYFEHLPGTKGKPDVDRPTRPRSS